MVLDEGRFWSRKTVLFVMAASILRLFGSGKKGESGPSPQVAIQKLRETEEMLNKKSDYLEKKIDAETASARKHGMKNKRGRNINKFYHLLVIESYSSAIKLPAYLFPISQRL